MNAIDLGKTDELIDTKLAEERQLSSAKAILDQGDSETNKSNENDRGEIAWYDWIW